MEPIPKKLLDQVSDSIRRKQYSHRTERAYINWIRQYILFHDNKHPRDMGAVEVDDPHLNTRNQANTGYKVKYWSLSDKPSP